LTGKPNNQGNPIIRAVSNKKKALKGYGNPIEKYYNQGNPIIRETQ